MSAPASPPLLQRMADAFCAGDVEGFVDCFTPDGVYDEGFYGRFVGPERLREMLVGHFYARATEHEWRFSDTAGTDGLAWGAFRYSFTRLVDRPGERVVVEGFALARLREGCIASYEERYDRGVLMLRMGVPPDRILRRLSAWAAEER